MAGTTEIVPGIVSFPARLPGSAEAEGAEGLNPGGCGVMIYLALHLGFCGFNTVRVRAPLLAPINQTLLIIPTPHIGGHSPDIAARIVPLMQPYTNRRLAQRYQWLPIRLLYGPHSETLLIAERNTMEIITKECTKCKEVKAENEFHKSDSGKSGLRAKCKQCMAVEGKEWQKKNSKRFATLKKLWRANNPKKCAESARKSYLRLKKFGAEAKGDTCSVCHEIFEDTSRLHWHHRDPDEKMFCIGKRLSLKKSTVLAEIAKCDVLCSDCHVRHHHPGEFKSNGAL